MQETGQGSAVIRGAVWRSEGVIAVGLIVAGKSVIAALGVGGFISYYRGDAVGAFQASGD